MIRNTDKLIIIALILVSAIPVIQMFTGKYILDGDLNDSYVPAKYFFRQSLLNWNMPLQNRSSGLGYPYYRETNPGIYHFLNLLSFLPVNIFLAVHIMLLFNLIILGTGAYILMMYFSKSRFKALIFSVIMILNSYTVSKLGHYSVLCSIAASFWFIYFAMRAYREKRFLFDVMTSISVFVILSGGHPQIMAADILIIVISLNRRIFSDFRRSIFISILSLMISSVILLPLVLGGIHSERIAGGQVFTFPLKGLLYTVFPLLHYSAADGISYTGPFNIYEVSVYFSFLIPAAAISLIRNIRKRRFTALTALGSGILLIALSFMPFSGMGFFTTPERYFGPGMMALAFFVILNRERTTKYSDIIIFAGIMALLSGILIIRGYNTAAVMASLAFSFIYCIIMLTEIRNLRSANVLLVLLIILDLSAASAFIYKWGSEEDTINVKYDMLENKTIITYIPEYHGFYDRYIKDQYNIRTTEVLKKYSAIGDRGVFYNAYSVNTYNTLIPSKYLKFFSDTSILSGIFSNVDFLFNPGDFRYDYVFVPSMPMILHIRDSLYIHLSDEVNDSMVFYGNCTLRVNGTYMKQTDKKQKYLQAVDNLYSAEVYVSDSILITGSGIIYMISVNDRIVQCDDFFEMGHFRRMNDGPFSLFENTDTTGNYYLLDIKDGGLAVRGTFSTSYYDYYIGLIISIAGLLMIPALYIVNKRKRHNGMP